jgi:chromate reductase
MTQLRLLGLFGSLRRASNSTAVLRSLQDAPDDGEHAPESVRALRSAGVAKLLKCRAA